MTYLLPSFCVFCQFHFAHATCSNCLAQCPSSRAGGRNGCPPLGAGWHLPHPGVCSYTVDRHGGGCRGVGRIACMRPPMGVVAGWIFGAAGCLLLCDVALLVISAGDVVEPVLLAVVLLSSRSGGCALRTMRPVNGSAGGGGGADDGG